MANDARPRRAGHKLLVDVAFGCAHEMLTKEAQKRACEARWRAADRTASVLTLAFFVEQQT
jgi:hypothetical protein